MDSIVLYGTLGNTEVDALIRQVIDVYEKAFPAQIAAYYIEGSYADQTFLATSDIDMVIVFHTSFAHEEERREAERLWTTHNHTSTMEVDITVIDEHQLQKGVTPNLKLGSRLIYGQDICNAYPILPIQIWTRERMHAAYWLLVTIYQRPVPVHIPVDFPASEDEFYGYANRSLRLPDGQDVPCTRNLVRTVGWAATALLALQAGQYAVRKRNCARLYREYIGDEWASHLDEVMTFCLQEWQYLIPAEKHARQQLRAICERTLQFERHFLALYKLYLLEQLDSSEQEAVRFARWVQEHLPLEDREVMTTIEVKYPRFESGGL